MVIIVLHLLENFFSIILVNMIVSQSLCLSDLDSETESANQLVKKSPSYRARYVVKQSVNQTVNFFVDESISQLANESVSHSVNLLTDQCVLEIVARKFTGYQTN